MNTRFIMTAAAIALGIVGLLLTFISDEILIYFNLEYTKTIQFLLQILGALYFGFGMLNWMTKTSAIGGIYNRPIVVANLTHFSIAALALIKGLFSDPNLPNAIWIIGITYLIFAISFGILLFQHPKSEQKLS